MATITRTYSFTDGTTAYGSQVESEVSNIVTVFNNHDSGSSTWTVVQSSLFKAASGTAAAPTYTYSSESTTGFFFSASAIIGVSLAGTDSYQFQASKFVPSVDNTCDLGSSSLGFKRIYIKDGLVGTPAFTFALDTDCGMWRSATNEISWSTGGTLGLVLDANQDLYTATFADYSGSSTVVGWTSFTTKQIYYKKIGKFVFVTYRLIGTSNSTTTSFSLPYSNNSSIVLNATVAQAIDNTSSNQAGALLQIPLSSSTATLFMDSGGTTWTGSGTKNVAGQFFYQAA